MRGCRSIPGLRLLGVCPLLVLMDFARLGERSTRASLAAQAVPSPTVSSEVVDVATWASCDADSLVEIVTWEDKVRTGGSTNGQMQARCVAAYRAGSGLLNTH